MIRIFTTDEGFGYIIIDEINNIHIYQSFKPEIEGFQPMDEIEANMISSNTFIKIKKEKEKKIEPIIII